MNHFTIDEEYITCVTVVENYSKYRDTATEDLTADDIVSILKHQPVTMTMIRSEDHPEFKELRNRLGELGYIRIERSFINGDRVLRPFSLNEWKFKPDDRFLCAGALRVAIDSARKMDRNRLQI